jgi:anti-anti-sigma factor
MLAPTRQLLDITVVCSGSRRRIILGGELDLDSGRALVDVAVVLAAAGVAGVDIDLTEVSFIDTAGWEAVGEARRRIAAGGGASTVVAVSPAVTRFWELAGHPGALGYRSVTACG